MPIYEYRCNQCGEKFDVLVWSSEEAEEVKCKKCGSKDVKRTISLFGVAGKDSCSTPT